jgi:hypothetical protein
VLAAALSTWWIPPGLPSPAVSNAPGSGRVEARWRPEEISQVVRALDERAPRAFDAVPLGRRVAIWGETIAALLDPESDERRALLSALVDSSRLSPEGVTEALEVVLGGAGTEVAARLAAALPPARARGVAGIVLAANVPALAVQTVLPALLLGRPLLLRSSAREPLFAPALLAALARREPALGEAFGALTWPHDDALATAAAFGEAERVLAYGGAGALAGLAWLGERLVGLGPKASVAFVAGRFDEEAEGRRLAKDVALFDQRGCLSVQSVWVEGDARAFAEALAWGLAHESRRLPPGPVEPETAALVQQIRIEADLRGALIGRLDARQGSVIVADEPRFLPVPGMRTVRVHAVTSLDAALAALAPERGRLQGAALVGDGALGRGAEIEARLGLARVAPAGRLQHAEAGWRSGGIDPLATLS